MGGDPAAPTEIVLLPGDGIGPEVLAHAWRVLEEVGRRQGHRFVGREELIGGAAIDRCGSALPRSTLDACLDAGAVLLGF